MDVFLKSDKKLMSFFCAQRCLYFSTVMFTSKIDQELWLKTQQSEMISRPECLIREFFGTNEGPNIFYS